MEKNLKGCYECLVPFCHKGLLNKNKPYAFNEFIRRYGITNLLECLERNEKRGIVYHQKGIVGDYDDFDDLEDLITFIKTGNKYIIKTDRLRLRKLNEYDFDNLKAILSDKQTMKYYREPYNDEGVYKWLRWNYASYEKRGFGLFAVELKHSGIFIGDCGITLQKIDGEDVFEIGYHFNKNYWNNGYASEAAKACKKWFFENTEYEEVYSYMNVLNVASRSVALNNGMSFIKEYEDGDEILAVYRITRKEYLNK